MDSRKAITAYCMDWHINKSDAFRDMLTEPLKARLDIRLTAWDGDNLPPAEYKASGPVIFCMLPPPLEFARKTKRPIIWLPMWDQAQGFDQTWWNSFPKNVKVVAFSNPVTKHAQAAGLDTLVLRYYKNPDEYPAVNWQNGNKVFYWNRTGLIGPAFLKKLCQVSGANELIFLGKLDPRIEPKMGYNMPSKFGDCKVKSLKPTKRETFLRAVEPANIFIAPRTSEGVGMTFLEAMARGCAVLAYDAPTMNEYIKDGYNGLLFSNQSASIKGKILNHITRRSPAPYLLNYNQDWQHLKSIDFKQLGENARQSHMDGYKKWLAMIPKYAKFVFSNG